MLPTSSSDSSSSGSGRSGGGKGRLQRTLSGGVARRDLIVCRGGTEDLASQYDILGRLGRGGFGTVQKAKHKITGLLRAIKTIAVGVDENGKPNELPSDQSEWDRIMAEVQALMALDHPNIVRLYEYYRDDHALYLVEEYCSGGTLEAAIERAPRGRLSADDAALALRQMLRALVCCHAHGLAHRDLKPDNFVYGSKEPTSALKMIDFGLSFSLGPDLLAVAGPDGVASATCERVDPQYVMAAGTLEYAAPETLPKRDAAGNLKREALYSQAADMWSLGAILFIMLTGEPLVDLDRLRSSTADMLRNLKAVVGGVERDLLDETALKVRNQAFIDSRLARARRLAPPAACELLEKLLVLEPSERITATAALKDRFVTDSYMRVPAGHGIFDAEIVPKMRRFAEAPALRRLAVLVEAHLLGPSDDEAVQKDVLTFRAADTRGLGVLTAEDISAALKARGLDVPDDMGEIVESIDINQSGSIDLVEFMAATMDPQLFCEPRLCKAAFRVLDADADGYITRSDLEKMLIDGPHRSQTAREILQSAGEALDKSVDRDGRIDFRGFCNAMLPRGADPGLAVKVAEYMSRSFV